MTLTDTGPLLALLNRNDPHHASCLEAAKQLPAGPLVTTWPCFTEAMYLLLRAGGYRAQAALWRLRADARLIVRDASPSEIDRMAELMEHYQDKPMDLADASLVAAAEHLGSRSIFTLDSDFHIYRLANGRTLEAVP